jgi:SAM-dependent methyltransferase
MSTFGRTVNKIWATSPRNLWIAGRRRGRQLLGKSDEGWNYSLEAVLASSKHMNPKMELERWERQWRICRRNGVGYLEAGFDFAGKSVVELGCGPVLGIGPVALFKGAEKFWYREPDLLRDVLESARIKERYFVPMYEELVSNYGRLATFDQWYSRLIETTAPLPDDADQLVDITLSNSVLEHIPDSELSEILKELYRASRPGGGFSHTVDFGPHGGRLSDVYLKDRRVKPHHLNLLRKSEMEHRIKTSGLKLSASILYKADEIDKDSVHESWKMCSIEDLQTRVMHFIGSRPGEQKTDIHLFETVQEARDHVSV